MLYWLTALPPALFSCLFLLLALWKWNTLVQMHFGRDSAAARVDKHNGPPLFLVIQLFNKRRFGHKQLLGQVQRECVWCV